MSELELYYVDDLDPDLDKLKYFIRLNNRISNMRSNLYLTSLPTYNIFILLLDHLLDKDIYSSEIISLSIEEWELLFSKISSFTDDYFSLIDFLSKIYPESSVTYRLNQSINEANSLRKIFKDLEENRNYKNAESLLLYVRSNRASEFIIEDYPSMKIFPYCENYYDDVFTLYYLGDCVRRSINAAHKRNILKIFKDLDYEVASTTFIFKKFVYLITSHKYFDPLVGKPLSDITVHFYKSNDTHISWNSEYDRRRESINNYINNLTTLLNFKSSEKPWAKKIYTYISCVQETLDSMCKFMNNYVDHILRTKDMSSREQLVILNNFTRNFNQVTYLSLLK